MCEPSIKKLKSCDEYDLFDFTLPPALEIKLIKVADSDSEHPSVNPSFESIRTMLTQCFDYVIESAQGLPRIETLLFPEFEKFSTSTLHSVSNHEDWVLELIKSMNEVLNNNYPNVKVFSDKYKPFSTLLSGQADEDTRDVSRLRQNIGLYGRRPSNDASSGRRDRHFNE